MKIIRFESGGKIYLGNPIDAATATRLDGSLFDARPTDEVLKIDKLLAPLVPTDILCIGLNYADHAKESGSAAPKVPVLFIKASGTLNNPGDPIFIPKLTSQVDFEAELAIVIGRDAKNVSRNDALDYVFGYTCANDVSARDWQRNKDLGGGQFARGKSFDSFCPLGPWIVTKDELPDTSNLSVKSILNGRTMQDARTELMLFDVPALIESLSSTMTVRAGSVILTGTPAGVGFARTPPVWMKAGDTIVVEIEGIGRLENVVANEV